MIEDSKGALTNIIVTNPLENDICVRYCNLQGEGARGFVGRREGDREGGGKWGWIVHLQIRVVSVRRQKTEEHIIRRRKRN
jgi:hypothetical protein